MLRVLTFCEYASLNGGERSFLEAAKRLDAARIELVVAAPAAGPLAGALDSFGISRVPLDTRDTNGVRTPPELLRHRLTDLIARCRPQVVHANSLTMSRLVAPVASDLRLPALGHLRDIMRISRAARDHLNRLDRLVAVSEATRRWYLAEGLDASRVVVAYNGVDLDHFRPRPPTGFLHAQLGIPASSPLVGTIGQLGLRKGTDLFLDMATVVAARHPDTHFVLVGQRYSQKAEAVAFERQLWRTADTQPLRSRCHFLGTRTDIALLLNELKVYVHAARQEPLGRVLLEAAAAGTPVVATDVGGTREIFGGSGHAASLVPPDDPASMAREVQFLLDNHQAALARATRARQRCQERFDADSAAQRLTNHFLDLATRSLRARDAPPQNAFPA